MGKYKYWDLGTYNAQTGYIAALVQQHPIQRKKAPTSTRRTYSRIYTLDNEPVCRDTFIHTLRISPSRVNTALFKANNSSTMRDKRGLHSGGNLKQPVGTINLIKDHIRSFPSYKSHYCREERATTRFLP